MSRFLFYVQDNCVLHHQLLRAEGRHPHRCDFDTVKKKKKKKVCHHRDDRVGRESCPRLWPLFKIHLILETLKTTHTVYVVYGSSLTLPVPTGKMPLAPAGPNVEDRDSVLKSKQVIRTHTES